MAMSGSKRIEAVSYAMLARKESGAPASRSKGAPSSVSGGLRIGDPNDAYEREAESVANEVMVGGVAKRNWSLASVGSGAALGRKCSCGDDGGSDGECEKCKQEKEGKMLQRKATGPGGSDIAPPIVHEVLNSPGRPLDRATRDFFEPRFGYDFSRVRVHADATAHKSAAAVHALAYTVGNDIVFDHGGYSPTEVEGRKLLAHELAHTIQQRPVLSRQRRPEDRPLRPHDPTAHSPAAGACYGSAICHDLKTPSKLRAEAAADPSNKEKRDRRQRVCGSRPRDPACTADGHGSPAIQAAKLLHDYDPNRPVAGVKMLVDKDLEHDFGALTIRCNTFVPPVPGATDCITIPEKMEKDAAQFNDTADPTIGGMERGKWRERTLEILVHESEHTRVRADFRAGKVLANTPTCTTDDVLSAMNELAAMLTEFRLRMERIRTSVALSSADRAEEMNDWRRHRILGTKQSITVSLRTARCACNCDEANKMIREAIEFATASWTQQEKNELHREMRDPRWHDLDLRWPFVAPPIPSIRSP
jgi:hypothetical protein